MTLLPPISDAALLALHESRRTRTEDSVRVRVDYNAESGLTSVIRLPDAAPKRRPSRARAPEQPTEKQVQRAVKQLLELYRVAVFDTSQPFRAAITPGVPDLICFCPKRGLFFVEVKTSKGRQSPAQRFFGACCRVAGIGYVLGGTDAVRLFLERPSGTREPNDGA